MFNRHIFFSILLVSLCSTVIFGQKYSPNYDTVFPQGKVNTLKINIKKEDWQAVQQDMKSIYKIDFGQRKGEKGMFPLMPQKGMSLDSLRDKKGEGFRPPMMKMSQQDPKYIGVNLSFQDSTWHDVSFRLKGNSSLMMSWSAGIYKLPFRLNFGRSTEKKKNDFYGFKELSMSPAMNDNSLMREKIMADIFRASGVYAPQTAYYQVFIDFGEGEQYCGIYTMVEVVDDTMIETQFGEKEGNIYKPESTFARFDSTQFEKKNHKKQADWSDVKNLISTINSPKRNTNPAEWRYDLEQVFNVNHFLKWLAVNSIFVNWDTYGAMAHNSYLYHSHTQQFIWIPWDNNESLKTDKEGSGGFPPPSNMSNLPKMAEGMPPMMGNRKASLSHQEVGKQWVLIRFLLDDALYAQQYKKYVAEVTEQLLTSGKSQTIIERNYEILKPFASKEQKPYSHLNSAKDFTKAFEDLQKHLVARQKAVESYLKTQNP